MLATLPIRSTQANVLSNATLDACNAAVSQLLALLSAWRAWCQALRSAASAVMKLKPPVKPHRLRSYHIQQFAATVTCTVFDRCLRSKPPSQLCTAVDPLQ